MKKSVIAALVAFGFTALSAHAGCTILSTGSGPAADVLDEGTWKIPQAKFDATCQKLERAHAKLVYVSTGVVLGGKAIGWSVVMVGDRDSKLVATAPNHVYTVTSADASQDTANKLAFDALNSAVANFDVDSAIAVLDAARQGKRKN